MRAILHETTLTRASPGHDFGWLPLYGLAYRGQETASKYRADIRTLPAPDTLAGAEAAKYLEATARDALEHMTVEERRVRRLPQNITLLQSIRGLNNLELALATATTVMLGGPGDIETFVPKMKTPFQRADSCKKLVRF